MIKNSFVFLDRIGYKKEERLWRYDILCWDDFLDSKGVSGISSGEKERYDRELEHAGSCLKSNDSRYFSKRLKSRDHWRLYPEFKDRACYIDIETTGLNPHTSEITVIGVSDGRRVKSFVKGINLSEEALVEELSKHRILISFYGSAFDLPFIMKKYPQVRLTIPHIDLCFTGRRAGLSGGLKTIEKELGISREEDIDGVDGLEAIRLWKKWEKQGDREALEQLLEYNRADVANLRTLSEIVYQRMWDKTFLNGRR
jgi:uncharacterized protein YprB with RNaseH-like and TPR domain